MATEMDTVIQYSQGINPVGYLDKFIPERLKIIGNVNRLDQRTHPRIK